MTTLFCKACQWVSAGWIASTTEGEDDRPFAYTIGLHDRGLPELLITGLPPKTSTRLLNSIAHQIVADGTRLQPAMHIDYQGPRVEPRPTQAAGPRPAQPRAAARAAGMRTTISVPDDRRPGFRTSTKSEIHQQV